MLTDAVCPATLYGGKKNGSAPHSNEAASVGGLFHSCSLALKLLLRCPKTNGPNPGEAEADEPPLIVPTAQGTARCDKSSAPSLFQEGVLNSVRDPISGIGPCLNPRWPDFNFAVA